MKSPDRGNAEARGPGNIPWQETFFKNTGDLIFIHAMEPEGLPGPLLEVNPAACRLLGYSREELLKKNVLDFIAPERKPFAKERTAQILASERKIFETILVSRSGERIPVEVLSSVIRHGGETIVLSVARDLRPWEETRRKEREHKKFLEDVFEAIQDGISVLDRDMVILKVNRWMVQKYGFRGKMEGRKCYDVYHGRDSVCPWCPTVKAMETGEAQCAEVPFPFQEGGPGWMELTAYPLEDEEGNVTGVIEHVRDVTEKKKAQEARDLLLEALDQSGEILALTDSEGRIQYVNRAFERVTGFTREEALGKTFALVKSGIHDERFYQGLWTTILSGGTWTGRFRNRRKDGTLYFEYAVISPLRDKEGEILGFAKSSRDVTRELALEERLQQAQKLEAVGTLAGGIAHDFNNLLLAIMGNLDLALLAKAGECKGPIEEARKAALRAAELTRQLLAFSRRQVLKPVDMDLNPLIRNLLAILRRLLGEKIEIDFIPSHSPGTIHADPAQMEQVVMNLVLNARDAMPEGGKITIETENVVINGDFTRNHPWARQGRYLLLSVTDTGEGMPQEVMEHIFEPFYSTKEVGKGTGLGLATVYGIVQQHGGMIHAYSEVGKGSTFKVYIPIVERPAAAVGPKLQGPVPGGKETILLAEDDPAVRDLMTRVLETAGYAVLAAGSGGEALELFHSNKDKVHMALLDVVMPGKGGASLAREFRAERPGLPILFTSGYPSHAMGERLDPEDEARLLSKPFDGETLLRKVRDCLEKR